MPRMQRLILLLVLLQSWLYGCLSCVGGVIYINTHLDFRLKDDTLQQIGVRNNFV